MLHILLHALVPGAVAWLFYRERWRRAWGVMMLGLLIDADHLLATPIYDPNRCSIGFHPLHSTPAIALYALLLLFPRTRLVGVGLVIHIALDALDCAVMR